jgi:hypothetical protein
MEPLADAVDEVAERTGFSGIVRVDPARAAVHLVRGSMAAG